MGWDVTQQTGVISVGIACTDDAVSPASATAAVIGAAGTSLTAGSRAPQGASGGASLRQVLRHLATGHTIPVPGGQDHNPPVPAAAS